MNKKPNVCVIDSGQFVWWAIQLSEYFNIFYYKPWNKHGMPDVKDYFIGYGYDEITKIDDIFSENESYKFNDVDLFIVTDLYFGDTVKYLRSIGKLVWGTGPIESLEINRWEFQKKLTELKLPTTESVKIKGLDKLDIYLKDKTKCYVKISKFRNVVETFRHENYELSEPLLQKLKHDLGAVRNELEFIVQKEIKTDVEYGYDGITIDGQYWQNGLFGCEIKDSAFLIKTLEYKDLPKSLKDVNEKFAPTFKKEQYRGNFSTEMRGGNKNWGYFTDITQRCPSPPCEVYTSMIDNWSEILIEGAKGFLIEPKFNSKYGGQLIFNSEFLSDGNWQSIYIQKSIRKFVKLRYSCKIKDKEYCVPQGFPECGSIIALGNTMNEVLDKLREYAGMVKGYDVCIKIDKLNDAIEAVKKTEAIGIKF
jgi:hypothetical protein